MEAVMWSGVSETWDSKRTVVDMAAAVAAGKTPPALADLLERTFPRREPGRLARLFGARKNPPHIVHRIELFDDKGFFVRCRVFQLYADEHLLEGRFPPHGHSFGLFALTPAGLLYLMRHRRGGDEIGHREALEDLFQQEGRPLQEANAFTLASLFCEAFDRSYAVSGIVLQSADELSDFQRGTRLEGCYELDPREWNRVRTHVKRPSIEPADESGWVLEYCSVTGLLEAKKVLSLHRVAVASDFRLTARTEVLSEKIFQKFPYFMH